MYRSIYVYDIQKKIFPKEINDALGGVKDDVAVT